MGRFLVIGRGIAVSVVVIALVAWAVVSRESSRSLGEPATFVDVKMSLDHPGTVTLPSSWAHVSHEIHNAELALAASPRHELLEGAIDGNRVSGLTGMDDLRLDDVFVEVWASYQPVAGGFDEPVMPPRLDPDDFEPSGMKFGEPINDFVATGREGGRYTFRYWSGPESSAQDRDAMLEIIRSMRF